MIFEEQFPAQRNTPVSKIDKLWHYFIAITTLITTLIITNFHLYLIQLWWQFFQYFCLWGSSLCSNLGGIDPEKLYQATLIQCISIGSPNEKFGVSSGPYW